MRPPSASPPRLDRASRVLRLQADERLAKMLLLPARSLEAARLLVPSRESIAPNEVVRVEVSFGPLADEIVLRGVVVGSTARGDRAPLVEIEIAAEHGPRVRYIHDVLACGRQATARASRRVAAQIQATWRWGLGSHAARIGDISRGGAFIRSGGPPSVGSVIALELNDSMVAPSHGPLELDSIVAWVGRSQGHRGFGVKFRVVDRVLAHRIAQLVRWHEQQSGLID
ncbi:MAG: PilZ domain-containing protein [Enhygromyxa sp.]